VPFKPSDLRWFHATRLLGALCFLYGLLIDHTPDRATLILAGAGMMGLDKVARSEKKETEK
jgi:hypothetical protein